MADHPTSRGGEAHRWRAGWLWLLALVGATAFMSFYALDRGAELETTDCWVAQTAREMDEQGDWVVPRFGGEKRLQKSPGGYWAVLLAGRLSDRGVDALTVRLPNAAAAVVLVATIFLLTRRIAGDRAAVFSGFASASSVCILFWSHRGATDLGVATLLTISLACLWAGSNHAGPRGRAVLWLAGYFAAGCAMIYKMPMPLPCVGVPAVGYLLIRRRWGILRSRWHLLGLVLFCAPWLPWVVAAYLAEPTALDMWRVEFLDRFTGDLPNLESDTRWYSYFAYLAPVALFTVPYTLSLPAAVWRVVGRLRGAAAVATGAGAGAEDGAAREGVDRDGMVFMLIWFVGLFAFFTIAADRQSRYILAALPPLFVMLGPELAAFFDSSRATVAAATRRARRTCAGVWIGVPLVLAGGGYGLWHWQQREGVFAWSDVWPPYAVAAAIIAAGSAAAAWLYLRGRRGGSFAALVATSWAAWLWVWPKLMPIMASQAPGRDFAEQLRDRLEPRHQAALRQVAQQDPRVVWYSGIAYPRLINQLELLRMQGGRRSMEGAAIIGEEIIRRLRGDELVLLVATRSDFERFGRQGPMLLESGEMMPAYHLWLVSRVGRPKTQYVLFGNEPPPWQPPALDAGRGAVPPP